MSSGSDNTTEDTRAQTGVDRRNAISVIRRMTVRVTSKPFWQAVGVLLMDGVTKEAREAEVFSNVGFYARPKPGANVDAIVAFEDGAENPYIIATRDEGTRRQVAKIDQDETIAWNSLAVLLISKAGKVIASLAGHAADAAGLAKASELNNLRAFVMQQFSGPGHGHAVAGAATTTTVPVVAPVGAPTSSYPGTDVFRAQ